VAFSKFRYHRNAEEGLTALLARGEEVFNELKKVIRNVLSGWEPEDKDHAQLVVVFHDYFLNFTVAQGDKSCLVLAAVVPKPRI